MDLVTGSGSWGTKPANTTFLKSATGRAIGKQPEAGRGLEQTKVDLIYAVSTSVVTLVRGTTTEVPMVFAVGSVPVSSGLITSFARPGGVSQASIFCRPISQRSGYRF